MADATQERADVRARIVAVAAELLHERGPGAVTTRGVADAAGVQAPTIYRLFGDKDGLLDAVAEHVMSTYVAAKADVVEAAAAAEIDPLEDLRAGWRAQVDFGLANPDVFRLLSEPARVQGSPAALRGRRVLEARIRRVAASGRLRVPEGRAVDLFQSAGVGVIQTLLATPPERRDPDLAEQMLDAVLGRILTGEDPRADDDVMAAMVAARAVAPGLDVLSPAERAVLAEWLDRAIESL